MHATRARWIAGAMFLLAACRGSPAEFPSQQQGVRWTSRAHGEQHSTQREHVALPFALDPEGTNGTATLLGYLKAIEARGARYVSDVSIAIQIRHNGAPIECISRIVLEEGASPAQAPSPSPSAPAPAALPAGPEADAEPEYETTVRPWQPGQSRAWVTDRDLVCSQEGVLVTGHAAKHSDPTAAETGRLWASASNPGTGARPARPIPTSRVDWEDRCQLQPVRREVLRYDHFVAARFAPPDLALIGRRYSDWRLTELPPVCHPIEVSAGTPLQQRVEAEVYFAGSLGQQRLPKALSL